MSQKKKRLRSQPPCRELGSDDGIDPRYYFRPPSDDRRAGRKTGQLCAQVARAITRALRGRLEDERLHALEVIAVQPAPDLRRLRVILVPAVDAVAMRARLEACVLRAVPRIREAVAADIHRRRVPELVFEVRPRPPGAP